MSELWTVDLKDDDITLPKKIMDVLKVHTKDTVVFEKLAPGICLLKKHIPE